jgi:metal-sulfur cluster biosynthetic enzyme
VTTVQDGAGHGEVRRDAVDAALATVTDPELPMSVVDLGLICAVRIDGGRVEVDMTLTSTGCPCRDLLVDDVRNAAAAVRGVSDVQVNVVWDEPWTSNRVSSAGRKLLALWGIGS